MPDPVTFAVVTSLDGSNNWYDSFAVVDSEGVLNVAAADKLTDHKTRPITHVRVPVWTLGEICILNEWGREICGRGRKPSKWFIEVEEFDTLEEAIRRSHEILDQANKAGEA